MSSKKLKACLFATGRQVKSKNKKPPVLIGRQVKVSESV
jgi:hypothetical protein